MNTVEIRTASAMPSTPSTLHRSSLSAHAFTCLLCRRGVALDAHDFACNKTLPTTPERRSSTDSVPSVATTAHPLHGGGFMKPSSGVMHPEDYIMEWRRLKEAHVHALESLENSYAKPSEKEKERLALNPSEWDQRETVRRQQLHPAVKGSLLSASGKYAPLKPSLSPWLDVQYAQLKQSRTKVSVDMLKTSFALTQARLAARLSPNLLYQYSWMSPADAAIYLQEMWSILHDSLVPPLCPLNRHLTTLHGVSFREKSEKQRNQNQRQSCHHHQQQQQQQQSKFHTDTALIDEDLSLRAADDNEVLQTDVGSPSTPFNPGSVLSPLTLRGDAPEMTAKAAFNRGFPNFSSASLSGFDVDITVSHKQPFFHMHKLQKAIQESEYFSGTISYTLPSASHFSQQNIVQSSGPPLRETFLATFFHHLMRSVVREVRTDLPLCTRCWKESLETQQKNINRIFEDFISLSTARIQPDVPTLVLCYSACEKKEKIQHKKYSSRNDFGSNTDETHTNLFECKQSPPQKYVHDSAIFTDAASNMDDVVQLEWRRRLRIKLLEIEARSCLLTLACESVRNALNMPKKRRREEEERRNFTTAINNTRQFASFLAEDAASGVELRVREAVNSCTFLTKMGILELAFPIDTHGVISTIAGLRLGQLRATTPRRLCSSLNDANISSTMSDVLNDRMELHKSKEGTALLHMQYTQCSYTRILLGSRNEFVSVAEINHACGYLLLLLRHLCDRHSIEVCVAVLHPNGDQSTVDALTFNGNNNENNNIGSPIKTTRQSLDFFISEKIFSWKTFGAACATVASCVQEIVSWMVRRRTELKREAQEHNCHITLVAADAAPYVISHGVVDGSHVRHGKVSEQQWTTGMKKLLKVVQWCVLASRDVDHLLCVLKEKQVGN